MNNDYKMTITNSLFLFFNCSSSLYVRTVLSADCGGRGGSGVVGRVGMIRSGIRRQF